ncbi:MAG: 50S ribosome-binding GTPase [Candidatus Thermoplasmatota archaeon]|jgi:nucleolar GTP-binding protein|nr:50S ribosome-binding GTPase [Candidatus Thermoplasmatota archaeon]MCL5964042.1 50S ribosome-binding GTPase [Candidatus Thermoplasmatota archaeon]
MKKYFYLHSDGLLTKAFNNVDKVSVPYKKGIDYAYRKKLSKCRAFGNTICSKMDLYVKSIPTLEKMDEFHKGVIEIEIGIEDLRRVLSSVSWASKKIASLEKTMIKKEGKNFVLSSYFGRIKSIVMEQEKNFQIINMAISILTHLPYINPDNPVIVVIGYPNVGKSMFIGYVSTLQPSIAPYPFTTKKIEMGHFTRNRKTFQILDTPGIIDRVIHNKMENLSLSAVKTVAKTIIFMIDPTEQCGWPISDQELLLQKIRNAYTASSFIEVETKSDLLKRSGNEAYNRIKISSVTGEGIEDLLKKLDEMYK